MTVFDALFVKTGCTIWRWGWY